MKILSLVGVAAVVGIACYVGCSKESRDEAINRLGKAGKALNGEVYPDDADNGVANIVREQQRKERIRQNTTWTAENIAHHPKEYCQAQLEALNEYAAQLDVSMHKLQVKKSVVTSAITDAETSIGQFTNMLEQAKASVRASLASGTDKVEMGGYSLTVERAKKKMVLMNRRVPMLRTQVGKLKNALTQIGKSIDLVEKEQEKTVSIREKVQAAIDEIELKNVIEGDKSIVAALDSIHHNIKDLGVDYDDPSIESIAAPSSTQSIDAEFEKLMAE